MPISTRHTTTIDSLPDLLGFRVPGRYPVPKPSETLGPSPPSSMFFSLIHVRAVWENPSCLYKTLSFDDIKVNRLRIYIRI